MAAIFRVPASEVIVFGCDRLAATAACDCRIGRRDRAPYAGFGKWGAARGRSGSRGFLRVAARRLAISRRAVRRLCVDVSYYKITYYVFRASGRCRVKLGNPGA
jgi:hypothetical protein